MVLNSRDWSFRVSRQLRPKLNKKALIQGLTVVVFLASAGFAWYYTHRQTDCAFSGWKESVGVEADVAIGDVKALQGKVGITDEQSRKFDVLMNDFALKYDAACMDSRHGRMSNSEYLCRRRNMDQTLNKIRVFVQEVEATKMMADPSAQKEIVLNALSDLEIATKSDYSTGCTTSLDVAPRKLYFGEHVSEQAVQITNYGNNPVIFTAGSLPSGFIAEPKTGTIGSGTLAVIAIYRVFVPLGQERPLMFHVLTNFNDDVPVEIEVAAQNAGLYDYLAGQALVIAANASHAPTMDDALKAVDSSLKQSGSSSVKPEDSVRYMLAAGVLSRAKAPREAKRSIEQALTVNPALASDPATRLLQGVILSQLGDTDGALEQFIRAKEVASPDNQDYRDVSDLFYGVVTLKGDKNEGVQILSRPEIRGFVARNPGYLSYAGETFKVNDLDKIVAKKATPPS